MRQQGVTLIELIITIAVLAVLLSIAMPNFSSMLRQNRTVGQSNELLGAISYARSEALLRGVEVAIQPTDNLDWASGLSIVADTNRDGVFAADEALNRVEALGQATATATVDLVFRGNGWVKGANATVVTLRADGCKTGEENVRTITVKPAGQVTMGKSAC